MSEIIPNTKETIRRGNELYEREIRAKVESANNKGKMLALDVDSGEYAIGDDSMSALDQLKAKKPNARAFILRIGFPTAVKIGAGLRASTS